MSVPPADAVPDWVAADPFRAHLAHVAAVSGLPWPLIALHAGVSVSLARHLLFGRQGRRVTRISAASARRILAVTPATAGALRSTWVDAGPTVARLVDLLRRGAAVSALAATLALDSGVLLGILEGHTPRVPAELSLRVRALQAATDLDAARPVVRAA